MAVAPVVNIKMCTDYHPYLFAPHFSDEVLAKRNFNVEAEALNAFTFNKHFDPRLKQFSINRYLWKHTVFHPLDWASFYTKKSDLVREGMLELLDFADATDRHIKAFDGMHVSSLDIETREAVGGVYNTTCVLCLAELMAKRSGFGYGTATRPINLYERAFTLDSNSIPLTYNTTKGNFKASNILITLVVHGQVLWYGVPFPVVYKPAADVFAAAQAAAAAAPVAVPVADAAVIDDSDDSEVCEIFNSQADAGSQPDGREWVFSINQTSETPAISMDVRGCINMEKKKVAV